MLAIGVNGALLAYPLAFIASAARGYLPAVAGLILIVVVTQILTVSASAPGSPTPPPASGPAWVARQQPPRSRPTTSPSSHSPLPPESHSRFGGGAECKWSDMAVTTVGEHRLAAGYAIFIPSSLAFGLLLAAHHPAFLAAGFGAALLCAGLARRYVQHWDAAEGRTPGWGREFGCFLPQFLAFHARRGHLPVIPMLALQLVPVVLLAGYWITLSFGVLFAL